MSEQKDMILENFLSSAIRTLDTDEIYNILMDSLILLLHPQGLLLTQNLNTGRSFCTVRRWGEVFFEKDYSVPSDAFLEEILHQKGLLLAGPDLSIDDSLLTPRQSRWLAQQKIHAIKAIRYQQAVIGLLNIALDPLFIFTLGMGTAGAALATGLSQFISFCILLWMCNHQESCISISIRKFRPKLAIYREIIYGGIPSLGRQGIASVATILLNFMCQPYGDAAIAAMSIVSRFMFFINSVIIGFGQGFQPVCSYCFGAGLYNRVKKACWFCIRISTIILLVLSVICFPASHAIISLFRRNDPVVIEIGTLALRMQLLTLPLQGTVIMGNMMPQSIGYGFRATLVSTSRQGIFLIPLLIVLTLSLGLLGIQCAQPLADIATFLLALFVIRGIFKEFPEDVSSSAAQ